MEARVAPDNDSTRPTPGEHTPPEPTAPAGGHEIRRIEPERPWVDVMAGAARLEIGVLDHGFIALVDAMPRLVPQGQTADSAIVRAARVSYGEGTRKVTEDRGLIRYLMRHRHTTPFEMVELTFHVAMPVFIARQWIRHRTANVNEYSARYSIVRDRFYRPGLDAVRKQSASNRQGGEDAFDLRDDPQRATAEAFLAYIDRTEAVYPEYLALTERGVSREMARIGLPQSMYTEWYWKCDLHNTLRFLSLRLDPHAQLEIRAYAAAMMALLEPLLPHTLEAFRDYELGAIRLTRLEIEALKDAIAGGPGAIASDNSRERTEWEQKKGRFGVG